MACIGSRILVQRALLVSACTLMLGVLILLLWQLNAGLRVDTNLKSLSPAISDDPVVTAMLDALTAASEKRFVLVFAARSQADAEDAAELFSDLAQARTDLFSADDGLAAVQSYVQLLQSHQFHLLRASQIEQLTQLEDEQLITMAARRVRGLSAGLGLLPLRADPFGFANQFARGVIDELSAGVGGVAIRFEQGEHTQYAFPALFQIAEGAFDMRAQRALIGELTALQQQVLLAFPGIQIWHSGVLFFAAEAAAEARSDVSMISAGSAIGVLALIVYVFRTVRPLLLVLLSVAVGVTFAFCVSSLVYSSVHVLTIVFGASLVGVVVDYSLHFFYVHGQVAVEVDAHEPARGQVKPIDGRLLRALSLSLITSVAGYAALSFSGLLMLQQVALFSMLGLFAAWTIVVGVGPYVYQQRGLTHDAVIVRITQWLVRKGQTFSRGQLRAGFLLLAAVFLVVMLKGVAVNDTPAAFFSLSPSLLAQERQVDKLIANYEPASFLLIEGNSPERVYENIALLEESLANELDTGFLGVHRLLPSAGLQQRAYDAYARLYGADKHGTYMLRSGGLNAESVQALQTRYASAEHQALSPAAFMREMEAVLPPLWLEHKAQYYAMLMLPKHLELNALADYAAENAGVKLVRVVKESTEAVHALRVSASSLLLCALLLVALIMVLRYRRLASVAMVALPASSIMITLLVLQLMAVPVTLFHIMALFLVIGLGMDYIIFLREIKGESRHTSVAVVLSAITSLLSFGLLAFSSLPVMSAFGVTVVIGNSCNLLGALLLSSASSVSR